MLSRGRLRLRRARLQARALLVRGDIRSLPFRSRPGFNLVMAPYGILQSLTRERDLKETLASVARVVPKRGLFGIDLVPDLPRWSEYEGRKSFAGTLGPKTHLTLVESVRQDRGRRLTIFDHEYIERRGRERRVHRFSLTFRTLSVPQMSAPARGRGLQGRSGPRRLPRRPVGQPRRCVDHPRPAPLSRLACGVTLHTDNTDEHGRTRTRQQRLATPACCRRRERA